MRDEMVTLINQVTNLVLTTGVLLFGTEDVLGEINVSISKAEQKYIKTAKRFAN